MIYVFEGGNVVYDGDTITEEQKAQAVGPKSAGAADAGGQICPDKSG